MPTHVPVRIKQRVPAHKGHPLWDYIITCTEHPEFREEAHTLREARQWKWSHEFIYHGMRVVSCGQLVHPHYAKSKEFTDWRKAHGGI